MVLTYDGDEAGQNATRRAIPILEKTGLQVRVLRMEGAKDPDEYLRKFGADRFELLLRQSENQAEYRLQSLQRKFDLSQDDQRVEFLKQAANLVASFPNAVEREVYGTRAAEAAGITAEAMKLEVNKAYKRRLSRQEKEEQRVQLSPAVAQQPKVRALRYDNVRSAMAEEALLRMVLREPALFAQNNNLRAEQFSSPVLGKTYQALLDRYRQHLTVSLAVLEDVLTPEEMTHLTAVVQKEEPLVSEAAFADYCNIIQDEFRRKNLSGSEDLLAMRNRLKDKKGYGG